MLIVKRTDCVGKSAAKCGLACRILTKTSRQNAAHNALVKNFRFKRSPTDRFTNYKRSEIHSADVAERAKKLSNRCANRADNYDVVHCWYLEVRCYRC